MSKFEFGPLNILRGVIVTYLLILLNCCGVS